MQYNDLKHSACTILRDNRYISTISQHACIMKLRTRASCYGTHMEYQVRRRYIGSKAARADPCMLGTPFGPLCINNQFLIVTIH